MSRMTVLVAARQHPVSGRPTRSPADAKAVAVALAMPGGDVQLLSAGSLTDDVARDYLAQGARSIEVIATDTDVCAALVAPLQEVPWVLTGTRSAEEAGGNLLPFQLGAALNRPVVTQVVAIEDHGTHWIVTQALPKGARRRLKVTAPAVLAVSEAAPATVRYALADKTAGRIFRTGTVAANQASAPASTLVLRSKRRAVLQAKVAQSGHARMLGAIDSPSSGGLVVHSGSPEQKAQVLLDYLRRHALVNF
jgi:electron transfer flavoprotein beta subunit